MISSFLFLARPHLDGFSDTTLPSESRTSQVRSLLVISVPQRALHPLQPPQSLQAERMTSVELWRQNRALLLARVRVVVHAVLVDPGDVDALVLLGVVVVVEEVDHLDLLARAAAALAPEEHVRGDVALDRYRAECEQKRHQGLGTGYEPHAKRGIGKELTGLSKPLVISKYVRSFFITDIMEDI